MYFRVNEFDDNDIVFYVYELQKVFVLQFVLRLFHDFVACHFILLLFLSNVHLH